MGTNGSHRNAVIYCRKSTDEPGSDPTPLGSERGEERKRR